MHIDRILVLVTLSALLASCGDSNPDLSPTASHSSSPDTVYTEGKAMNFFRTDPERALVMIDSAVIVGNITPMKGEYLKAVTQFGGLEDIALARQTCLELLNQPQIAQITQVAAQGESAVNVKSVSSAESAVDTLTVMQTLGLLTEIEMQLGNSPAVIRYGKETSRLAHLLGQTAKVGEMEGIVAQTMNEDSEQKGEGIDRLRQVVSELRQMDTYQGFVTYHNTAKKLLHLLYSSYMFEEMASVCESMLQRYDELEQHPDRFRNDKGSFDPADFLDFARGQTYAFLTVAYAWQCSSWGIRRADGSMFYFEYLEDRPKPSLPPATLKKKALEAEAAAFRTKWSKTSDCDKILGSIYYHLGQFDRFDASMDRLEAEWQERGDTISWDFRNYLQIRGVAAQVCGNHSDALDYWMRSYIIKDSLEARNQREQLAELATQYHLQEEQFARYEAEADARFLRWVTAAAIIIVVLAVCFAVYFFYKRRETMKKNRVLAHMIAESINSQQTQQTLPQPEDFVRLRTKSPVREGSIYPQASTVGTRPVASDPVLARTSDTSPSSQEVTTPLPHREGQGVGLQGEGQGEGLLFAFLRDTILREQLYLDASLDRHALVDRFGLSKERIGAAFAKGSPYKSLIDFLTDCRLPHAARLLTDCPDLTIAEVAQKSGFPSADTFGRNFKQKYTLTPTQYRESNRNPSF